jgi:hypothetical protein
MADKDDMYEKTGYLSPKDMEEWAMSEIRDSGAHAPRGRIPR